MERNTGLIIGIIGCIIGFSGLGLGAYNIINSQVIEGPQGPEGPPGSENMIELSSGIYTGLQLYGKNVLIPEGNNVTFQNAKILGGELYVYGNLTIIDSQIDHSINGYGNGQINITDMGMLINIELFLYENSKVIADNITALDNDIWNGCSFILHGSANLVISNSIANIKAYDESIVNATNLSLVSAIRLWGNSRGTIKSSILDSFRCFEQVKAYFLEASTTTYLYCYGTPNHCPFNNATIYKDGTSTIISPPTLNDDAQIIDI
ncbi:MAG: hypothetical protein JXA99_03475 [Candidatus Lokiarchaeota archaeon]|nr:hypothetical protein [Candidatus Lokiarchaeota archaeon]